MQAGIQMQPVHQQNRGSVAIGINKKVNLSSGMGIKGMLLSIQDDIQLCIVIDITFTVKNPAQLGSGQRRHQAERPPTYSVTFFVFVHKRSLEPGFNLL